MSCYLSSGGCLSFVQALAPFHHDEGLPFASVLPVAVVEQAFADEGIPCGTAPKAVFTPDGGSEAAAKAVALEAVLPWRSIRRPSRDWSNEMGGNSSRSGSSG